jgi:nucleoid-associated protein YgaU
MDKEILFMLLLSFTLVSCSGAKKTAEMNSDEVVMEIVSDEDTMEAEVEIDEEVAMSDETAEDEVTSSESMTEDSSEVPIIAEEGTEIEIKEEVYTVGRSETLMMISFKIYGDYSRWREIAEINKTALNGTSALAEGMKLKYLSTGEDFNWNPEGNPYLIKKGDSLTTISTDVYATFRRWKEIWNNNRPLIKDPDKIYVGFTIYYVPDQTEEVALK